MEDRWFCELTPPGAGGLSVMALGGRDARSFLAGCFRPLSDFPPLGHARPGRLFDGADPLDECVLVCLSDERFELHLHGSPAVVAAVEKMLERARWKRVPPASAPGVRLPRLLSFAVGARSARLLVSSASPGAWNRAAREWLELAAAGRASEVAGALAERAAAFRLADFLFNPPRVVLAGAPNAGKSTLFNALLHRNRALVSEHEATTHDLVEERLVLRGFPLLLVDSPGTGGSGKWTPFLEEVAARGRRNAALVVEVLDLASPSSRRLEAGLVVGNKADLPHAAECGCDVVCSSLTGEGVDEVARRIADALGFPPHDDPLPLPVPLTPEHAALVERAAEAIRLCETNPADVISGLVKEMERR